MMLALRREVGNRERKGQVQRKSCLCCVLNFCFLHRGLVAVAIRRDFREFKLRDLVVQARKRRTGRRALRCCPAIDAVVTAENGEARIAECFFRGRVQHFTHAVVSTELINALGVCDAIVGADGALVDVLARAVIARHLFEAGVDAAASVGTNRVVAVCVGQALMPPIGERGRALVDVSRQRVFSEAASRQRKLVRVSHGHAASRTAVALHRDALVSACYDVAAVGVRIRIARVVEE